MATLFLSCVSNEFGNYREAIRKDLTSPNLETKIQEDFKAGGLSTLEKLDNYIKNCEAVIQLCGNMAGSPANEFSLDYLRKEYPYMSSLSPLLDRTLIGDFPMTYTQWEAWLGLYHKKPIFLAIPKENAVRDNRFQEDARQRDLQLEHLKALRKKGVYPEIEFATEDELVKKLALSHLGELLRKIPPMKTIILPYHPLTYFKGRDEDIRDIESLLGGKTQEATSVALIGLGGIGKTRLAIEYGWANKDHYHAIFYVNSGGAPEILKSNIGNLSAPQNLNLVPFQEKEEEFKFSTVIRWLNKYTRWLLIIDQVDTDIEAAAVEDFFSGLQNGHLLITTRIDQWSLQIKKKKLKVLSKVSSAEFLLESTERERIKKEKDQDLASQIGEELGHLALALEQARAYIVTKEISLTNYYGQIQKNKPKVLQWFKKELSLYPQSVALTWQTSLEQLSDSGHSLLYRLCWFATDPIPKELVSMSLEDEDPDFIEEGWEELKKYSLVFSSFDKETFSVHQLVQEITRYTIPDLFKEDSLLRALKWLDKAFKGDPRNVEDWPRLEPLLNHLLILFKHAKDKTFEKEFTHLMNDLGVLIGEKADFKKAEHLLRNALEIDENNHGPNHPEVANRLENLALLLKDTNRFEEAELLMRRALEINEINYGTNHPSVAKGLNNLALLLMATNQLEEAETRLRSALKIGENNNGPNHSVIGAGLGNLALLLMDTNRFEEAEPLILRALDIVQNNDGQNHPKFAIALNNLAILLQHTNRQEEAKPHLRKALEINEKYYGPNHPKVATALINVSHLFHQTDPLEEVEPLIQRALEIYENCFGSIHPNIAITLGHLAQLRKETKRWEEAEHLLRKGLGISENCFGSNHPKVAKALDQLAQLLKETDRLEEAEPLIRRALEIAENSYGPNHPTVAERLNNLALLLMETNRSEEAESKLKRSCLIINNLEYNHFQKAITNQNYRILLINLGKTQTESDAILSDLLATSKNPKRNTE